MLEEYNLNTLKERARVDSKKNYESFNITKELEKVRERLYDNKSNKKKKK